MRYTFENCLENAKKYKTKKEWREKDKQYYFNSWKKGWIKECSIHMEAVKKAPTDEECITSSKKYKHKLYWMKECTREYSKSKKDKDLYKKCTSHMTPLGNRIKRLLYKYYAGNECYIGITFNYTKRVKEHKLTERYKNLLNKYGYVNFEQLSDILPIENIITLEKETIENHIKNNWIVLNKSKGGEIGGSKLKITDNDIIKQALNFNSSKEWRSFKGSYYSIASYRKILKNCTKHMIKKSIKRSPEELMEIAKKYDTRQNWRDSDIKTYNYAYKKGLINICCSHMKVLNSWVNYEIILEEALKFKTTIEWKKHSAGSYAAAFNKGWWKNISKQIKEKRNDTL